MSDELSAKLKAFGQDHLLRFWEDLNDEEKTLLKNDIESVDLEEMDLAFKAAFAGKDTSNEGQSLKMEPIDDQHYVSIDNVTAEEHLSYQTIALEAISQGQVGVLLLAGGQGTRLGVPYPKGMYNIGLPSEKTLYQIQCERILRLQKLSKSNGKIMMYLMTSEHTKSATKDFFEKHKYFGLDSDQVVMFEQKMIPCFDFQGKILLESKTKIARAPDGNGGLYRALKEDGILDKMEKKGVKFLHVYCVDNVLVKVADPAFMGYCISTNVESANKVVEKIKPDEAVGVVCKVDGKVQVVEYSEISKENAELRNPNNPEKLQYSAGNICNHFFTFDFLKKVTSDSVRLPYHVAKKKIKHVDLETSEVKTPTSPNGIKLEKFVFDVFQFAETFSVWECRRWEEFSPLKNADGSGVSECPKTAREAVYKLHKSYLIKAGATFTKENVAVEISPLKSYSGENLEECLKQGKVLDCESLKIDEDGQNSGVQQG